MSPLAELSTPLPGSRASTLQRRLASARLLTMLLGAAALTGAALRVRQYVADRSLWLDESFLALNLIRHGVPALLGRLDFNQGAAPGFLVLEKGVEVIGRDASLLRLPPLVFGLASLILAWPVARRICAPAGAVFAYALMALSPALVYYSSELKQYSGDVACGLAVTWSALELVGRPSRRAAIAAAVVGIAAVFFSHPAIFVVAGGGAALVVAEVVQRRRPSRPLAIVVGAWAVAAGSSLVHTLSTSREVLSSYHATAGLGSGNDGTGGRSAHSFKVVGTAVFGDLGLPTGGRAFTLVTLVVVAIGIVGGVVLLRTRLAATLVVTMPAALAMGANAIDHYPVAGRTVLFLVPTASICIGEGVAFLAGISRRAAPAVGIGLAAFAFTYPVHADLRLLRTPTKEEVRPLLGDVALEARPDDRFFVSYPAQYAVAYYGECGCTRMPRWDLVSSRGGSSQWAPAIESTRQVLVQPYLGGDDTAYLRQVRALPPGRIWVIVSHAGDSAEHAFLYDRLQRAFAARGPRLATIREHGALATLYALR